VITGPRPSPRPQPIRDAILAYLSDPRRAVDFARHIERPVPTTTGHLAAMRRLGLVDRVGYGLYALHGTVPAPGNEAFPPHQLRATGEAELWAMTRALSGKIRGALSSPCRTSELAVRIGEPRDAVEAVLERMWLSGIVTGNEREGFELVVRGRRRRLICERILGALRVPRTVVDVADRLDISIEVARRRILQLREAGAVVVGERGRFVRLEPGSEPPPKHEQGALGSFATVHDSLHA
jgi:DNA-binding transcriptional ArsR family regulator